MPTILIADREGSFRRELLGSFSPKIWCIEIAGPPVRSIDRLNSERRRTFEHEFGHMLHYFTSYLGLLDLSYWIRCLRVLTDDPSPTTTPEENITARSRELISITREKQILSIDDEYYFEPRYWRYGEARARQKPWLWKATTGGLFKTDGSLSDHRFWGLRFCLALPSDDESFVRIPAGMRSILEHMATGIDFFGEFAASQGKQREQYLARLDAALYEPELLHYHAFYHFVYTFLRGEQVPPPHLPFIACAQLIDLLTHIPFDVPEIWAILRRAAESRGEEAANHMNHPHPSFLVPLLATVAAEAGFSLGEWLNPRLYDERAQRILTLCGLPSMQELHGYEEILLDKVVTDFQPADPTGTGCILLREINRYARSLTTAQRLRTPACNVQESQVPLVFDDGAAIDGTILPAGASQDLEFLRQRYQLLVRFPLVRDIVV